MDINTVLWTSTDGVYKAYFPGENYPVVFVYVCQRVAVGMEIPVMTDCDERTWRMISLDLASTLPCSDAIMDQLPAEDKWNSVHWAGIAAELLHFHLFPWKLKNTNIAMLFRD